MGRNAHLVNAKSGVLLILTMDRIATAGTRRTTQSYMKDRVTLR
jgi:hypothetical protein